MLMLVSLPDAIITIAYYEARSVIRRRAKSRYLKNQVPSQAFACAQDFCVRTQEGTISCEPADPEHPSKRC